MVYGIARATTSAASIFRALTRWLHIRKTGEASPPLDPERPDEISWPASLPGIDLGAGLKRIRGNRKLLLKLLGDFHQDYKEVHHTLLDALEQGDMATVQRAAHTIKGVAESLGAHAPSAAARELELAAREGRMTHMADLIDTLHQRLTPIFIAISGLRPPSVPPPSPAPNARVVNVTNIAERQALLCLFTELTQMLEQGRTSRAEAIFAQIRALTHGLSDDNLYAIGKNIEDFNFDEALARLKVLVITIQAEPGGHDGRPPRYDPHRR
ncbi:MAG: Hpt domain-containing protein [Magnetococcales bacterium]|nr:Hpt domain-containing protein [Magnetococcales bacterium]